MKRIRPFTILAGLAVLLSSANAEDPQELKSARAAYEQSVQRAVDPLKERYLATLSRLRETYTRAGKLQEAVAVDTEIKTLSGQSVEQPAAAAAAAEPRDAALGAAPAGGKATVVIAAQSDIGSSLGAAKKGQRIRIQYVDGQWTSAGGAPQSPDNAPHPFVKLAVVGRVNGKDEVVMVVPNNTKSRAFSESFKKDYEEVWLRINDHTKADNAGEVTYKASIR